MSSKSLDKFLEDPTPWNRMVGTVILIALALVVGAILFGWSSCSRPEPIQMIPSPMPAASSAAIASSSAAVTASQGIRIMGRRLPAAQATTPRASTGAKEPGLKAPQVTTPPSDSWEWVIEATQSITAAATSSALASAFSEQDPPIREQEPRFDDQHGRLGIIAATMPGILAADLQLVRVDVSPVTRWLVDVDMEVGLDVAGNLEAGAVGLSAGGKAFVIVGAWSRWNLWAQGVTVGAGLRL